ncbi:hypothetical protein CTRI78_v007668 [Colletotrichum trifolii]|uniref:Uncharacterized protein n=1 Tax=Colletotrichum trifolii TaxID=5466 RepID=A0A4R8R1F6_COLTR|nr:hypothetical protein CTRI78_v007668 [Colletotrichum trifolii]
MPSTIIGRAVSISRALAVAAIVAIAATLVRLLLLSTTAPSTQKDDRLADDEPPRRTATVSTQTDESLAKTTSSHGTATSSSRTDASLENEPTLQPYPYASSGILDESNTCARCIADCMDSRMWESRWRKEREAHEFWYAMFTSAPGIHL